jgi:hypothetical protein
MRGVRDEIQTCRAAGDEPDVTFLDAQSSSVLPPYFMET